MGLVVNCLCAVVSGKWFLVLGLKTPEKGGGGKRLGKCKSCLVWSTKEEIGGFFFSEICECELFIAGTKWRMHCTHQDRDKGTVKSRQRVSQSAFAAGAKNNGIWPADPAERKSTLCLQIYSPGLGFTDCAISIQMPSARGHRLCQMVGTSVCLLFVCSLLLSTLLPSWEREIHL